MAHEDTNREDLLLDWQLGHLNDSQRAWLEDELQRDETLRTKSTRLEEILKPLDHWEVEDASADLADRVLMHVERSRRNMAMPPTLSYENERAARSPFLSMRDLVAVAASIVLLVGVFVPGVSHLRNRSQRAACATNLNSIFKGVGLYRDAFAGSLPFAGNAPGAAWLPGTVADRPYSSNSRHLYLLIKLDLGPQPDDFVCPSCSKSKPMKGDDFASRGDFAECCNNSYSALNLAGCDPKLNPSKPIPYLSDRNPLFVNARFNPSIDPDKTNSPAHRSKGQMVLALDGSTRWTTTPFYGPERDNLWLLKDIRAYTGTESCSCPDSDVQLVPGYPETDPAVSSRLRK